MNKPTHKLIQFAEEMNLDIWQIIFEDEPEQALYAPAATLKQAETIALTYIEQWNLETKILSIKKLLNIHI